MSDSNSSSSGGIGFLGLLCIVFVVLKLTNFISWSWWWVTAPLWGVAAFVASCGAIYLCILGIAMLYDACNKNTKF